MEAFSQFVQEVREEVEAHGDLTQQLVRNLAEKMETLLQAGRLGLHGSAEPGLRISELMYEDARTDFVVVKMVWGPGAVTEVHQHSTWDIFGVVRGCLEVTNYMRETEKDLTPVAQFEAQQGDVTYLLPPEEAIHRLRNKHDGVTVTLHIYGDESDFTQQEDLG